MAGNTVGLNGEVAGTSYIALFAEDSFGSKNFASTTGLSYSMQPLSIGFKTEIRSVKMESLSNSRAYVKRVPLDREIGGTLETYLHPVESALLLTVAMGGGIASSAGSTGVYIHSITAGEYSSTIGSVAALVRKGKSRYWQYRGGRINTMKISGAVGEPVMCSCDFIFKDSTAAGSDISASMTVSTVAPFVYTDGVFRYHSTEASVGTSTVEEVITGFELTINNNLDTEVGGRALGSENLVTLIPGRRDVELKVTQRFDTYTAWTRFVANTSSVVQLSFQGVSLSSDQNLELQVVMPKVVMDTTPDFEIGSPGDIIVQELNFVALENNPFGTTASKQIGMTLYNGVTSY